MMSSIPNIRLQGVLCDPAGTLWGIPACPADATIPRAAVVDLLNRVDPLVAKIKFLSDLSPLVDEAPAEDKGRVALGLLDILEGYVAPLEQALETFTRRWVHNPDAATEVRDA